MLAETWGRSERAPTPGPGAPAAPRARRALGRPAVDSGGPLAGA